MNTTPTVLILGAAGRFGAAAVQSFAAAGWRVLAQQRRAPAQPLPAGAQHVAIDIEDTDALAERARDASVVVHAANPQYWRWEEDLLPLFQHGLAIAERLGARFMLPGNVYNYGAAMPALLSEDTVPQPDTRKAELRIDMEEELDRRAQRGLKSVVIRAGDFFGSGRGTFIDEAIAKPIARGRLVYPGPLEHVHAWAYLPDMARAFVAVAEGLAREGQPEGVLKLHFEGHSVDGHEFLAAMDDAADSLGLRPASGFRIGRMPWLLLRAAGLFSPLLREIVRMSYLWRVPHALDGRRLQQRFGPLPRTPLVHALRATLIDLGHGPAPKSAIVHGCPSSLPSKTSVSP